MRHYLIVSLLVLSSCSFAYHGFSRAPAPTADSAAVACKGSFTPVAADFIGAGVALIATVYASSYGFAEDLFDDGDRFRTRQIAGGVITAGYVASGFFGLNRSGDCRDRRAAAARARAQAPMTAPLAPTAPAAPSPPAAPPVPPAAGTTEPSPPAAPTAQP